METKQLKKKPGLERREVGICRGWLESEVLRRAGGRAGAKVVVKLLRDVVEKNRWLKGKRMRGTVGEVRRRAAVRIWDKVGPKPKTEDLQELYCLMIRRTAGRGTGDGGFGGWRRFDNDPEARPHASLWQCLSIWPDFRGYRMEWVYSGPEWPRDLQDRWVRKAKRGNPGSADKFEGLVKAWCDKAGKAAPRAPAARDVRAEAYLVRYLLFKDTSALAKAVRTFAFGNPEYSLAVELAEGQ